MSGRFLIRHKDGREYGLEGAAGVKAFKEQYEPQGFVIPKDQPNFGGDVWEAPVLDDDKSDKKKSAD